MNGPDGRPWPWGTITQEHTIGDFCIVESVGPRRRMGSTKQTETRTLFHPFYLNPERGRRRADDLSHSFSTLEAAITFAIAYKYQKNPNSAAYATRFIMRMIGAEDSQ